MSKKNEIVESRPAVDFLFYQTQDGQSRIEVRLMDETVWLRQKVMAELFQKDVRTINEHIMRIFEEGELQPDSVIRKFPITASDGRIKTLCNVSHVPYVP